MADESLLFLLDNPSVWLKSINLINFRNFDQLALNFEQSVNIFYGNNGSGKTNLLEAIFTLCLGRSQRGAADQTMIRDEVDVYRIEGDLVVNDDPHTIAVAYQRRGRKKITIDKEIVKLTRLYDNFSAVSVGPEDSQILSGSPSVRRNFIDIYLSQLSRQYLTDLADYQKVLAQKNAALKRQMDHTPFDALLIDLGSKIILKRYEFIKAMGSKQQQYYLEISSGESLNVTYQPSVKFDSPPKDIQEIETAFKQRLKQYAEREQIMKTSMIGPHRDDLYFEINGFPARTHGSQGQWRTAAIASKLAIYDLLKDSRNEAPVLLLDEIFAELDRERCDHLIAAFDGFSQLFLTAANDPPEHLKSGSRSFRIDDGHIVEVT